MSTSALKEEKLCTKLHCNLFIGLGFTSVKLNKNKI